MKGEKIVEAVETVEHTKRGSVFLRFVMGLIPIVNLYWIWKVSELLATHEKSIRFRDEE